MSFVVIHPQGLHASATDRARFQSRIKREALIRQDGPGQKFLIELAVNSRARQFHGPAIVICG
jgi:hypothetical protein